MTEPLSYREVRDVARAACLACGAGTDMAEALVAATLSAEWHGRPAMGLAHLLDYLDALRAGRIDGQARPQVHSPLPALLQVDGQRGIAQHGFDLAFDRLTHNAATLGIAMLGVANCYTAGELGYYPRRLAARGLVGLAMANSHAMLAPRAGSPVLYGTNPLAFAAPLGPGRAPIVIDQASSATAFVNLIHAAANGQAIPADWALGPDGLPTTDPTAAMQGALRPAGGYKGANLALLVEIMAAGLTGSAWSLDAGHFRSGTDCPGTGLTVIAIAPQALAPDFCARLAAQAERLAAHGVHLPGTANPQLEVDDAAPFSPDPANWSQIQAFARHSGQGHDTTNVAN